MPRRIARPLGSPCIDLCVLTPTPPRLCTGCGRTGDEIAAWTAMSETERQRVLGELPARLAALARSERGKA
ncbi:MAG: DUF1289 domain-containing protein [Bauldia sp.]